MKDVFGKIAVAFGIILLLVVMPTYWVFNDHLTLMQVTKQAWIIWIPGIVFILIAASLLDEGEI